MDEAHWQAVLADEGDLWSCDPSELTMSGCLDLLAMVRSEQAHLAAREAALLVAIAGAERLVRQVAIDDAEGDSRSFDLIDERVDLIAAATRRSVGRFGAGCTWPARSSADCHGHGHVSTPA